MADELTAAANAAREYLQAALGPRAPHDLRLVGHFDEQPLEGEGPVTVFRFDLPAEDSACGAAEAGHYVVVGATEPNYFPTYDLDVDQAYSLHLGTRFMLVLGVARAPGEREPADAWETLRRVLESCNPGVPLQAASLAGLFTAGEQTFAVYRVTLGGRTFYAVGGDLSPGFYELAAHPPQVALRLHLGQLIRAEARGAADRARSAAHAARRPD